MAYIINGKVYSDHPLMDEMIYNLNIIMKFIEVKIEKRALEYESEESITASDTFKSIKSGNISFDTFPFTRNMLMAFGYEDKKAYNCSVDRNLIPVKDRENAFTFCCKWFLDNYIEKNNYYRAITGLPWLDDFEEEDTYYVYIDSSYISNRDLIDVFDFSLPIHEYTDRQIAILTSIGVMDTLYIEYSGKEYKYLHFLGTSKMDLYEARRADKWDILYMPSVEILVADRFKQLYQANKTLYLQRFYSEAYKVSSDYYDEFMIIMLLCQTYTDMIADIPEWYVRRDVFDIRSCQYFLESHGIEFFREIPLKYQIRIVKNMNKLIKYKSTNKNIWDILDIFNVDNTTVYRHYLFKKRKINENGNYANGKNPEDDYELEFVKAPIGTSYDDTIKDKKYRDPYDTITNQDKWWDGQDKHKNVHNDHLAKDFTIEGTKFISIGTDVSLIDYTFQVEYFMGLLLDSGLDTDDVKISIPSISNIIEFPLSDLFILLYCLTGSYDGYSTLLRLPKDRTTKPKPVFKPYDVIDGGYSDSNGVFDIYGGDATVLRKFRRDVNGGDVEYSEITQESFYNWLGWRHPEVWTDLSCRVYGFNMNADMDWLAETIGFDHYTFGFSRGFTLDDLGVDKFIIKKKFSSIEEMVEVYENNIEVYKKLSDIIVNAQSRDEKVVFQFVFDYLFTKGYDYNRYTLRTGELANSLEEVLKDRNPILYDFYRDNTGEADLETKRDIIRSAMNDIINTLEYFMSFDSLKYIFSQFAITSFTSLLRYIYLMINFFKSYKVYFLDPYVTYIANNKMENSSAMYDNLNEIKINYWKSNRFTQDDVINTPYVELGVSDKVIGNDSNMEVVDVFGHYEGDPLDGKDIDGGPSDWSDESDIRDVDGGEAAYMKSIPFKMINGGVETQFKELYGKDIANTELTDSSGTIRIRVIDNQISGTVKLVSGDNIITAKDDGIYIGLINKEDNDRLIGSIDDIMKQYSDYYDGILNDIKLSFSIEIVFELIKKMVKEYIDPIINLSKTFDDTLKSNNDYTDEKAQEFNDDIKRLWLETYESLITWYDF